MILAAVVVVVLLGFIGYYFSVYNRFQSLKNAAEATLGQARVAMKKRLDMIEQLLGAVKSYAKFEKETLERVTAMRAEVFKAGAGSLGNIDRESRQILGNILPGLNDYRYLSTLERLVKEKPNHPAAAEAKKVFDEMLNLKAGADRGRQADFAADRAKVAAAMASLLK